MAIGKDTALRLMLVDDQVNEAEAIVSSLRNAGIAVRPLRPESLDELASQLAQQQVDLVLAEYASKNLPFNEVALVVGGCGRDVPLLAVLDGLTDEILDSVQGLGAAMLSLAPIPFDWQNRAACHSLVAKLRYPSTRFSSILTSRPWLSIEAMKKRSASAPYWSISSSGSTTLPFDLDIFWPSAARTSPCR